jgi:hypothetical protein
LQEGLHGEVRAAAVMSGGGPTMRWRRLARCP